MEVLSDNIKKRFEKYVKKQNSQNSVIRPDIDAIGPNLNYRLVQ